MLKESTHLYWFSRQNQNLFWGKFTDSQIVRYPVHTTACRDKKLPRTIAL